MKEKVLFMLQFFYPEKITSALLPFQTAEKLIEDGYDVTVYCGYPKEYSDEKVSKKETISGIQIVRLNYLQLDRKSKSGRLVNYFSLSFSFLLKIINFRKYNKIIVYSNPPTLPLIAALAGKIFDIEVIFVSYDVYPEIAIETEVLNKGSLISRVMQVANKFIFKNIDKVVALSNEMKLKLHKSRDISLNKIYVIPNWATEEGKEKPVKINKKSNKFVVSYLGNMGIAQDMSTLLGAVIQLRENKQIEFHLAGHGNKLEEIWELKKRHNLENLKIHGFLTGEDYEQLISITDVLVLSLEKEVSNLATPSKFYTYLYYEKPIIAIIDESTDISKEIKEYNLGVTVDNKDIKGLVSQILKLKNNIEDYTNNEDIYEEFYSKSIRLDQYLKLLESKS